MKSVEHRRALQFNILHLVVLVTIAAIVTAISTWDNGADLRFSRRQGAINALVSAAAVLCIAAFLMLRRWQLELRAGELIDRVERSQLRMRVNLNALALWLVYLGIFLAEHSFGKSGISSMVLVLAVYYSIVRCAWGIDPSEVEAREHGLIIGTGTFYGWNEISHYEWSAGVRPSLSLFLKRRAVVNLLIAPEFVERLNQILSKQIGKNCRYTE